MLAAANIYAAAHAAMLAITIFTDAAAAATLRAQLLRAALSAPPLMLYAPISLRYRDIERRLCRVQCAAVQPLA